MRYLKLLSVMIISVMVFGCDDWSDPYVPADNYWITIWDIDEGSAEKFYSTQESLGSARFVYLEDSGRSERILGNWDSRYSLFNYPRTSYNPMGWVNDLGYNSDHIALSHDHESLALTHDEVIYVVDLYDSATMNISKSRREFEMYPFFSLDDSEIFFSQREGAQRRLVARNLANSVERVVFQDDRYALINGMFISNSSILCKEYEYGRNTVCGPLALLNTESGTYETITTEIVSFFDYSSFANRIAYLTPSLEIVVLDFDTGAEIYRRAIDQHVEYSIYPTFNADGTKVCVDNYIIDLTSNEITMISLRYLTQPSMDYTFTKAVGLAEADLDGISKGGKE